jgi:glycosyltransferase involved in cell wall biosynthesis
VRALVRREDTPRLALFDVGPGARSLPEEALGLPPRSEQVTRLRLALPRRALSWLHRGTRVGANTLLGGVDLFHRIFPDHPPLGRVPDVLPLSDLPRAGSLHEAKLRAALTSIGDVIVASQHARDVVRERFEVDEERVHYVPIGCEHWARQLDPWPERATPARLLVLGRVDRARRPGDLARAVALLARRGVEASLVWAGRPGDGSGDLDPSLLRPDVPEAELPELVARSSVLVHLTDQVWTPVTPLEALAVGNAVVATRRPALVEALGDEAHWVAPDASVDELADALAAAVDASTDEAAAARRRALAERYSWDRCAALTARVWNRILTRS